MEHSTTGILLAALGMAGAIRLVPLAIEDLVSASERSLDAIARLIRAYRSWRVSLWPTPETNALPSSPAPSVARRHCPLLALVDESADGP
jgi:hypothetical protein